MVHEGGSTGERRARTGGGLAPTAPRGDAVGVHARLLLVACLALHLAGHRLHRVAEVAEGRLGLVRRVARYGGGHVRTFTGELCS